LIEAPRLYRPANTRHVLLVEVQIMDRIKLGTKNFIALIQMMQIGAAEIFTGITLALFIQWRGTVFVTRIP
jgi:hypothetical protein